MKKGNTGMEYHKSILDAIPNPILIVEDDVKIVDYNEAASALFGPDRKQTLHRRAGDALHCLHSFESPSGCGTSEFCKDCIIRNSVGESLSGKKVVREKTRVELLSPDGSKVEAYFLITTAPLRIDGKNMAMIILEDISELLELRGIIPICAYCKKVRSDSELWEHVEKYMKTHLDVDFTHSICPDCSVKILIEMKKASKTK